MTNKTLLLLRTSSLGFHSDFWFRHSSFDVPRLITHGDLARYGEEVMRRGMDRTRMESLSMEEFVKRKELEDEQEEHWRLNRGWPAAIPELRRILLRRREG